MVMGKEPPPDLQAHQFLLKAKEFHFCLVQDARAETPPPEGEPAGQLLLLRQLWRSRPEAGVLCGLGALAAAR